MTGRRVTDPAGGQAHAVGDGDVRHVRRGGGLGQRGRHARQERGGRGHRRGAARPARHRRLLAAAGRQGQQRARSSCVPQPVRAPRAALPDGVARFAGRRCGPSTSRATTSASTRLTAICCSPVPSRWCAPSTVTVTDSTSAILDVSRVDDIDDAARALLSGMSADAARRRARRLPRRPRRRVDPHRARVRGRDATPTSRTRWPPRGRGHAGRGG